MSKKGILLVSHGSASTGILNTVTMIMGEQEDIKAIELRENDNPDLLKDKIIDFMASMDGNIIILADVFGGTPFNTILKISREMDVYAVTGMNVPMVIEAVSLRDNTELKDLPGAIVNSAKNGVINMEQTIKKLNNLSES